MRLSLLVCAALLTFGCEKKPTEPKPADPKPVADVKAVTDGKQVVDPAKPDAPKPGDDAILLGEVGSLTGPEAAFGISTRDGIAMAIDEANEAGGVKGRKLAVRVYDDQSKPEEAASAATRLITQDKVLVILGEVASSNSLAMAPKAQEAKVPMISPSSTNPKVTAIGDYIFRVCFIDPFQGFVMAKYAREELKFNSVAIFTDKKSAYSEGLTEVFQKKFAELGGKIVGIESYAKGDTDFRAQLTNIKKLKAQGLYVPGYYQDVAVIAEQAKELGLKTTMMGGDGWDSAKLFELGGSAVDGSYVSNHYSADDPSPRVQEFIKKYQARYKTTPDSLAALGYDAARVAIDAMKRATELTGPAIREQIASTKDFPGVAGTITLDEHRNPVKPAVVLKVEAGQFKYVSTVAP
ncbi:MAG: ABC transporter substrate-binding protein [Myxococcaceae bacterium]|nr:ABC transporter substrate-binding protein [Myxococcaceae bacterium]